MKTVGYVCSFIGSRTACETQKAMIDRYCKYHHIICDKVFCDTQELKRTTEHAIKLRALGYDYAYKSERYFPAYEQMLYQISKGNIKKILVDTLGRLKACKHISTFFDSLCAYYNVEVVEVCGHLEGQCGTESLKIALYHFTDKSEKRPRVYTKSIDNMYEFVSQQKCWDAFCLYQDFSLKKSNHSQYQEFKKHASQYDVLLTRDFYHIEDKFSKLLQEINELENLGVAVKTLKEGCIKQTDEALLRENLQVAIYDCQIDDTDKTLELDRLKAFVKFKTSWTLAGIYTENVKTKNDSEQQVLQKLINEVANYDVVVVRKFNCFHKRTSRFLKLAKRIGIPIYSMKEGGIYLEPKDL